MQFFKDSRSEFPVLRAVNRDGKDRVPGPLSETVLRCPAESYML
jgi:hypothetical protein